MRPTKLRLLYVDDEPDLLHLVRTALRENPEIEVLTAVNAQDALDLLEHESIDVILSDYSMPRTNGLALLSEVRRRHGDVPFILFTGRGSEEVVIEALNGRADLFVRKQADIGALLADLVPRLHAIVARHQLELDRDKAEARYHAIFEHADRGFVLYDGAGRVVQANSTSHALLGPGVEERSLDDLPDWFAPEEGGRFREMVTAVQSGDPFASGRFSRGNGAGAAVELTLKSTTPDQLLLIIEDLEEPAALESLNRDLEKELDNLASTLRQLVERNTLVIRGLADQLSRSITDRRDLALIERITVANEDVRSTVAFALRHRGQTNGTGRFRPLLPIIRQAARAAGLSRDAFQAEVPGLAVAPDSWLERAFHQLFADAIRTGAEDLRLSATIDEDNQLFIHYRERSRAVPDGGRFEPRNERINGLRELLDDCPVTVEERNTHDGLEIDLCVPPGSYRHEFAEEETRR